jgi:peroxiredoxin
MKQHLLVLLSVFLLVVVSPVHAYLQQGEKAPDFELVDVHGKAIKLSDFSGRVVVLKLATTWCPTCKQQSEEIQSVAKELNAGNVVVLDVFLQDTQDMVDDYLPKNNAISNFVPVLDDGQVLKSYNVYLIPRLLLVDQRQKVRRDGGLMPASELKKQVQDLLGN